MASRPKHSKAPSPRAAGPWALLWLGGIAGTAWLPLLLADTLPSPQQTSSPANIAHSPQLPEPRIPTPPDPGPWLGSKALVGRATTATNPSFDGEEPIRPPSQLVAGALTNPSGGDPDPPSEQLAESTPESLRSGAVLLGGPLGLDSLKEKPMVPAARVEQALRARATDRLEAVPLRWRPAMRALIQGPEKVLPAEVVRLPAPHLRTPEEYPMAVKPDGVAETTITPTPRSRQTLERWAERQSPNPEGSVRPVILVLEPLPTGDVSTSKLAVQPETP